ncbi:MAG: MCE family protein [Spirochaetes bacterium]|nr:MCE family protein [Spirochaetota bacterium]
MAFTKNEIRVGLFIVVPLLILMLAILLKLGYSIAGATMDVYLKTDSITSIKKGTPIRIKGYQIGRVVEIKPVYKPALHFLATMRISRDIELYEDCTAIIQNQNIIGDPTIEFRNPERRGGPLLAGDVIEGIEVVNLEVLLGNVNTLVSNLSSTVSVIKQITVDSRQNLKSLVSNLAGSVSNLNAILTNSQKDLGSILSSFRETAKTMNEISIELKRHPMKFLFSGKKDSTE